MKRILIVDDHAENLYFLHELLSGHGFLVEAAHNGTEALVQARLVPPDLIISDLLMPTMDGYTLLRHWKADAALQRIPSSFIRPPIPTQRTSSWHGTSGRTPSS